MDIPYFPLVQVTSDKSCLAAMFGTWDKTAVEQNLKSYLETILPGTYKLNTVDILPDDVTVLCPHCGLPMNCLIKRQKSKTHSIYECAKCNSSIKNKNNYMKGEE